MSKALVLITDGVSLRNFVYSEFYKEAASKNIEIIYWNNSSIDLGNLGFKEIRSPNPKIHPLTELLKDARKDIELNLHAKKFRDNVYHSYKFTRTAKSLKQFFKNSIIDFLVFSFSNKWGIKNIRKIITRLERSTNHYKDCKRVIEQQKPSFLFCTNQRISVAIAPILAAQDLNIPTATFIFSWDNMPKAVMVVDTDFYFVWSNHMAAELLKYYPEVEQSQIVITGTPQFENHYNNLNISTRKEFFETINANFETRYICYSGDDVTTSPHDPEYLTDVCQAIVELNDQGGNFGILFRRCPVDFSNRYQQVLKKYSDIIVEVAPKWTLTGENWNTVVPLADDLKFQANTVFHSDLVINLGSTMVFDFAIYNKACAYINYDGIDKKVDWSTKAIYNYIHFRSMSNSNAVFWINSKNDIKDIIIEGVKENEVVKNAKVWYDKINLSPQNLATNRIVEAIASRAMNCGK